MRSETWISSLSAGLVVLLMTLSAVGWGCGETRHTIRTIDQHATDDLSTMSTADERVIGVAPIYERREYIGTTFWSCQQQQGQLHCQRVCDHGWDDDRLCSPELNGEFGAVNQPGAGVMATKYRRIGEERRRDGGEELEESEYADDDAAEPVDDEKHELRDEERTGDSDEPDDDDREEP